MNLKELTDALPESKTPLTARLFKDQAKVLMAVGLNTNIKLNEHKAPGRTKIIVLQGQINYMSGTESKMLLKDETFDIPLGEVHSVVGISPAVFLLLIA